MKIRLAAACLVFCVGTYAGTAWSSVDSTQVDDLPRRITRAEERLEEVRRDQLNYRVERDLLKETYSSNLQAVNLIIVIILGVFSVLGFLGLRSVGGLADRFRRELTELSNLRARLESQLADLQTKQAEASAKFNQLSDKNEEQDKRLKVLEIQEKVAALYQNRDYARALEYVLIGLELAPKDERLRNLRINSLTKLGRFAQSIPLLEELYAEFPENLRLACNLAELYLIEGRVTDYQQLSIRVGDAMRERNGPYLEPYFRAIAQFKLKNEAGLLEVITGLTTQRSGEKEKRIRGWEFDEVRTMLQRTEPSRSLTLVRGIIDFLDGALSSNELAALGSPNA